MDQKLVPLRIDQHHYEADLPFIQRPNGLEVKKKIGLRVQVSLGEKEARADISPFPGLCGYSLQELESDWNDLWDNHLERLTDYFNSNKELPQKTLNLKGPLEFALLTLKLSFSQAPISSEVLNNLVANSEMWKKSILENENFSLSQPIKVKVRPEDQQDFLLGLFHLLKKNQELPKRIIRLDGNANWDLKELREFWSQIQETQREQLLDYFEEPLKNYHDYKNLNTEIPSLSYAHEEHLESFLKAPSNAQALVVKPSQVGVSIIEDIRNIRSNKRIILSSAFELPESLQTLKYLANLYSPKEFHGLAAKIEDKEIKKSKD